MCQLQCVQRISFRSIKNFSLPLCLPILNLILNLILAWLGWSPSNLRFMTLSKLRNLKKSPCFSVTLLDSPSWPLAANLLR